MDALIQRLDDAGVRYLIIGGQAVRLHGLPRFSMDWALFVPGRDRANLDRLNRCLAQDCDEVVEPLGPRGENLIQTIQTPHGVLQFHLAVPGLPGFDEVESRAVTLAAEEGRSIRCLCAADLLASKQATNRPQDQQDILFLKEALRHQ